MGTRGPSGLQIQHDGKVLTADPSDVCDRPLTTFPVSVLRENVIRQAVETSWMLFLSPSWTDHDRTM